MWLLSGVQHMRALRMSHCFTCFTIPPRTCRWLFPCGCGCLLWVLLFVFCFPGFASARFFLLAGCNRSLGYRQSRLKRRKETEGPKHQSRSKSSALPLRPERLHSFCVKELGMRHKQQHKPKNTQQKPKTQTKQKHHNNHKREKSHP